MERDDCIGDDGFYFETDHLALRGNTDYTNMLKTIALLESQKICVSQQLEELMAMQQMYLQDPYLMINKLMSGQPIVSKLNAIIIAELPEIVGQYEHMQNIKDEMKPDRLHPTVRGRIVDETKPETFNQLWTCEEQRRLEELLIKYPPERKEMRRYAKIAQELGSRTPQQVCSRVQKYFLKLQDAGMPIPGRVPKSRRLARNAKQRSSFKPSTFFPAHNVPVNMPNEDEDHDNNFFMHNTNHIDIKEEPIGHEFIKTEQLTDDDENTESSLPASMRPISSASSVVSAEIRRQTDLKLRMLKIIRNEKFITNGYQPDPMALSCEECQCSAVSRTVWRCHTCYIDLKLCCDCLVQQLVENRFEHMTHHVNASGDESTGIHSNS